MTIDGLESSSKAWYIRSSYNNTISDINSVTTAGSDFVYVYNINMYNVNMTSTAGGSAGTIQLHGASVNITDSIFSNDDGVEFLIRADSTNNIFLNVSYDDANLVQGPAELTRKWHFTSNVSIKNSDIDTYVIDKFNPIVYLYNKTGEMIDSYSVSGGTTLIQEELTEYTNNLNTKTYYNNYSILGSANPTFYYGGSLTYYNLTTNVDNNLTIRLTPIEGLGEEEPPAPAPPAPGVEIPPEVVYIYENKTYCGDLICQNSETGFPTGNDFGIQENYWNCQQDCPGAIGENLDEIVYSFTVYCFDDDPSTVCFFTQQLFAALPGLLSPEELVNATIYEDGQVCYKGVCERLSGKTLFSNCVDVDLMTPCFWKSNAAFLVLFLGGTTAFALTFVKLKAPGKTTKKINPYQYVVVSTKKWGKRRRR